MVGGQHVEVAHAGGLTGLGHTGVFELGVDMTGQLERHRGAGRLVAQEHGDLAEVGGVVAQLDTAADQRRIDVVDVAC